MRYAFKIPNTADRRVLPIVNGEAARTPITAAKAKAEGYMVLTWPEDPAGPIAAVALPDYLPVAPDPAVAARAARLEALTASPEAATVSAEVVADLAAHDIPIDTARAFMRGLSPGAISSQFRVNLESEPMTTPAAITDEGPRDKRLREIRENVAPTRTTSNAKMLIAADTDPKRARLLEIKIGGIMSRAEAGDRAAIAKRKEIRSAEVLARANGIPLIHALAVSGVTL